MKELVYHVTHSGGGWIVRGTGLRTVSSYHDTRAAAEKAARFRAEMDGAEVRVHLPVSPF